MLTYVDVDERPVDRWSSLEKMMCIITTEG